MIPTHTMPRLCSDTCIEFQGASAGPHMSQSLVNQADQEQHTPQGKYTEREQGGAGNWATTVKAAYSGIPYKVAPGGN